MNTLRNLSICITFAASVLTISHISFADQMMPGEGVTIRPIEGALLEEKFQHQIVYRALMELGYEIAEPQEVEYQTIHLALGTGDGDFTTVHWDPLHAVFFEESGGATR